MKSSLKKKSVVWAEKNVIHNINNINDLLEEFDEDDDYDPRPDSGTRPLNSSSSNFKPKPILKKQGGTS